MYEYEVDNVNRIENEVRFGHSQCPSCHDFFSLLDDHETNGNISFDRWFFLILDLRSHFLPSSRVGSCSD